MAACDNLYGNIEEWKELRDFLLLNNRTALMYMKPKPSEKVNHPVRICYVADIQDYLIENCPLPWVQERLNENFSIQRLICGKAHHELEKEN